jgi:hypothetical protein
VLIGKHRAGAHSLADVVADGETCYLVFALEVVRLKTVELVVVLVLGSQVEARSAEIARVAEG